MIYRNIYKKTLHEISKKGQWKTGTKGRYMELQGYAFKRNAKSVLYDLLSLVQVSDKAINSELAWYFAGDKSIASLIENGNNQWMKPVFKYAKKEGKLPVGIEDFTQFKEYINQNLDKLHTPEFAELLSTGYSYPYYFAKCFQPCWNGVKKAPDSRNNEIYLGSDESLNKHDTAQNPCVSNIHFLADGDTLNVNVVWRSCDFSAGFIYDLIEMYILLYSIATAIGYKVGYINAFFGTVHIYENNYETTLALLDAPLNKKWKAEITSSKADLDNNIAPTISIENSKSNALKIKLNA